MDPLAFQTPDTNSPLSQPAMDPFAASAPERDPLLVCLALTAKRIDREVHVSALRAGFAVDEQGRIPHSAYPNLAQLHGMVAVWSRTPLAQLPA